MGGVNSNFGGENKSSLILVHFLPLVQIEPNFAMNKKNTFAIIKMYAFFKKIPFK